MAITADDDRTGAPRAAHEARPRVLIAGGGVAALEALLALRALAGGQLSVSVLTPGTEFRYEPVTVAEAFGRAQARSFPITEIIAQQGAGHVRDSLAHVDAAAHTAVTASGTAIGYDSLLIAIGARPTVWLPGSLTFGGRNEVPALRCLLDELVAGIVGSVAFVVAPEQAWSLPLYELALLTAAHLQERGSGARVSILTPETRPLEMFGPEAGQALEAVLATHDIAVYCSATVSAGRAGELALAGGGAVTAERAVTLPRLAGPAVSGLPADDHGFLRVDAHGRVLGVPDVYAAGDITDFALKQGGLATQQADAAAETIAAHVGARVKPGSFHPVLRGLLLTDGAPLYVRSEPRLMGRRRSDPAALHRRPYTIPISSSASDQALWWPPAKIAGRYLSPYLAMTSPLPLQGEPLVDRPLTPGPKLADAEYRDVVELTLLLADGDARAGDYRSALSALKAVEELEGVLTPEYEAKRRKWVAELAREAGR